jgi:hypothetical protein
VKALTSSAFTRVRPDSRLTLYDRSWRGLEKFKRTVEALFTGVWLGVLDCDSLHAVDRRYYDQQTKYHGADYNRQGLWPWEVAVLEQYFENDGAVLVASVGGGREAIGLRRLGYDVDAFECHPGLVRVANELLMREGFPATVSLAPRDECPRLVRSYKGVIVGWGGYMLIQQRARRVAFLRTLRSCVREDTPILLSFFSRTGGERYFAVVAQLANLLRGLRRRTQVEVGDNLGPNYVHFFTEEEIAGELADGGFRMEHFAVLPYGHAVGLAVTS